MRSSVCCCARFEDARAVPGLMSLSRRSDRGLRNRHTRRATRVTLPPHRHPFPCRVAAFSLVPVSSPFFFTFIYTSKSSPSSFTLIPCNPTSCIYTRALGATRLLPVHFAPPFLSPQTDFSGARLAPSSGLSPSSQSTPRFPSPLPLFCGTSRFLFCSLAHFSPPALKLPILRKSISIFFSFFRSLLCPSNFVPTFSAGLSTFLSARPASLLTCPAPR